MSPNEIIFLSIPLNVDYDTLSALDKTIDIILPFLPNLHRETSVSCTHFHPNFKNAPRLLYLNRHSPVPCFALVGHGDDVGVFDQGVSTMKDVAGSDGDTGDSSSDSGAVVGGVTGKLPSDTPSLRQQRTSIEHLYNRAAQSSTSDRLRGSSVWRNCRGRVLENKKDYVEVTKGWIDGVVKKGGKIGGGGGGGGNGIDDGGGDGKGVAATSSTGADSSSSSPSSSSSSSSRKSSDYTNPLTHLPTVSNWYVSGAAKPEEVWSDMWGVIGGGEISGLERARSNKSVVDDLGSPRKRFGNNSWLDSLASNMLPSSGGSHSDTIVSTMFLSPNFNTFNAESFKRFATTLSSSVNRLTDGNIFLVVFHPEYVSSVKGVDYNDRRSPFPMIQICYQDKGREE